MGSGVGIKPGYYPDALSYASGRSCVNLKWVSQAAGVLPAIGFPGTIAGGWLQAGGGSVFSIARTGTGAYTITTNDAWVDLLSMDYFIKQAAAYSAAGACDVRVVGDTTNVDATRQLLIQIVNGAGAAVDPAVSDVVALEIVFQSFNAN